MKQLVPLSDDNVATAMPVRNDLLIFSGGFAADGKLARERAA
jgi:hypothetical protein